MTSPQVGGRIKLMRSDHLQTGHSYKCILIYSFFSTGIVQVVFHSGPAGQLGHILRRVLPNVQFLFLLTGSGVGWGFEPSTS